MKITKNNFKKRIANFFGAFGYFFCSLLWFWTLLLYLSLINKVAVFMTTNADNPVAKPMAFTDFDTSMTQLVITGVITIVMLLLTVYILIKIPSVITKTSKKIVHETAENVTPLALEVQHKKDTKKNHIKLTSQLILAIKMILIIIPTVLAFISQFIEKQAFDFFIAMYISFWLSGLSAAFFMVQYFYARVFTVKMQDLW